jgi:hypothetical protein
MVMFSYDDEYPNDDDEKFYRETVHNEDYYIEQEQEMIRQSNLELELERLEDEAIRDLREEGLLRPTLVKPGEDKPETEVPEPANSPDDPGDLPF